MVIHGDTDISDRKNTLSLLILLNKDYITPKAIFYYNVMENAVPLV